ncbi:MAG TPA: hypothetical protein VFG68_18335 [Fimbriiglobus sp.]|nr:hypothetical protein [Fimbriiglobus sp.]
MKETYTDSDVHPNHSAMAGDHPEGTTGYSHQRSARNNEDMRDGDSSHGSPEYEADTVGYDTDRDIGDSTPVPDELEEEEAGVLESVPASQDEQPPVADPPAHVGLDATAGVDAAIDDRGTATTGAGEDPSAENEFAATVGADHPAGAPLDGYERLTVRQITARLGGMPEADIRRVRDYEMAHRRRKTLLVHLERRLQRDGANR